MKGAAFVAMVLAVIATAALEIGAKEPDPPAAAKRGRIPESLMARSDGAVRGRALPP